MQRLSTLLLIAAPLLLPGQERAQASLASLGDPPTTQPRVSTATVTIATRATLAPELDGKDDDPIWAQAQAIESFRQFSPKEDSAPTFRTVAKVAYDDKFLYVFVRMYDPHPDSIVSLLSRHDVRTQSEWIKVMLDSYHDKRSGYEFAVNPRGVKRDYHMFNDQEEDDSWDGVWDVATTIDSLGWTAEFRIPFDQLRFAAKPSLTMGIGIWRDIARLNERDSWPVFRFSKNGISSQLGEITGIDGLGQPRHLEIVPYVVAKNYNYQSDLSNAYGRQQELTAGGDIKYGLTSNLTLDGTVNPDFGQVESDPANLNLSNFETFLPEKRPFFVEGSGIFRFDMSCNDGACTGLFYSRRIGRQPQLSDGEPGSATTTSIMGAAKLTGRLSGGLSIGVLDALTAKEQNSNGNTSEPATNYFATQFVQEFREGQTTLAATVSAVNRQQDAMTTPYLRDAGYSSGINFHHLFDDRKFQIAAYVIGSYVTGSESAIGYTQTNSTHYYQRPGSGLTYDPTRTSLGGDAEKLSFSKEGGGITRFWTGLSRVSPGFEINDLGYLSEAGKQSWSNWFAFVWQEPKSFYRMMQLNFNESNNWTTQGVSGSYLSATNANVNWHAQLTNSWFVHSGLSYNNFLGVYDDRKARGGPAMFRHPYLTGWAGFDGDPRMKAIPSVFFFFFQGAGDNKSHGWGVDPEVAVIASSSLTLKLGLHYDLNQDYTQWLGNFTSVTATSYTFASLHQSTMAATVRVDATFTPTLSLQFYAQPYISQGQYENWRTLQDPRAGDYGTQFSPFVPDTTTGALASVSDYNFNYQQLNVNTVLRWEYRRGSALFLVWTHGRTYYDQNQQYSGFNPGTDVNNLFSVHPMNTFLIKGTYWISL